MYMKSPKRHPWQDRTECAKRIARRQVIEINGAEGRTRTGTSLSGPRILSPKPQLSKSVRDQVVSKRNCIVALVPDHNSQKSKTVSLAPEVTQETPSDIA